MPLLKVAQKHTCINQPPYRSYSFVDKQKKNWIKFWEDMDGDRDKILDFAKKADIENPEDWYEELHRFLFDLFAGDDKLVKKAAKKNFRDFLAQVAENHTNNPKERSWYHRHGMNHRDFVRVIEYAAEFDKPRDAVIYINARTPEYGAKLYSEWLLTKTQDKKEISSVASKMREKAYRLEHKILGDRPSFIHIDDYVKHPRFPNEDFKVVGVTRTSHRINIRGQTEKLFAQEALDYLTVEDKHGKIGYIFDMWNVV